MEFKDHYRTLGVSSTANLSVIKTSYRKLSKKFHPDVNDGDKFFEERFKEIQEAYEILSDDIKRRRYDFDRFGKEQSFQGFHEKDQDFKKEPESPNQDKSFTEEDLNANTKENNSKGTAHKPLKKQTKYLFFAISIVGIMLLLVYLFVKQGLFIRNDYKLSEKQIDEISKSYFINILDGNWQGRATQIEVKDSFDIELECNRISMQFKIIYPTLKCFLLF